MQGTRRTPTDPPSRVLRRGAAVSIVTALVAMLCLATAGPASAAVFEPGAITFTLTGGSINLNTGTTEVGVTPYEVDLAGDGGGPPITLTGSITEAGVLTIPKAGVVFPPSTVQEGALTVQVAITAVDDVVGSIDPDTGAASAPLTLAVQLTPAAGNSCTLTVPLSLSSAKTGGAPLAGGVLKLADVGFSVPVTTKAGSGADFLCGIVDSLLGLPAPRTGGTNSTVMTLTTDEVETPTTPSTTPTSTPTTGATTPTTATPTTATPVTNPPVVATYLPAGSIRPTYTCSGADDATTGLLNALGGGSLALAPELSMAAITPSPAQGDTFNPQFGLQIDLDPDLVAGVIALGVTEAKVSNFRTEITPQAGVEGAPILVNPPDQTIKLVAGQAARLTGGPFSGPVTRTSAIGDPVTFAVGSATMTLTASLAGTPLDLNLVCSPSGATVLSVTDQQGTPGPGGPGGDGPAVGGTGADRTALPRTGSTNLELSLAAAILLGLGVAVANEAALRHRRRA